jgi:hypothetical protein
MDERVLSHDISLLNFFNLALTEHIHGFISLDRSSSGIKRAESKSRIYPSLDETVILFNQIV